MAWPGCSIKSTVGTGKSLAKTSDRRLALRYRRRQLDGTVKRVYRHFARMLLEILHAPRRLRPQLASPISNWSGAVTS